MKSSESIEWYALSLISLQNRRFYTERILFLLNISLQNARKVSAFSNGSYIIAKVVREANYVQCACPVIIIMEIAHTIYAGSPIAGNYFVRRIWMQKKYSIHNTMKPIAFNKPIKKPSGININPRINIIFTRHSLSSLSLMHTHTHTYQKTAYSGTEFDEARFMRFK